MTVNTPSSVRFLWLALASVLLAACGGPVQRVDWDDRGRASAAPAPPQVLVVTLTGKLGTTELARCHRSIREAEDRGCSHVVFRLSDAGSQGEEPGDLQSLYDRVQSTDVPTIAVLRGRVTQGAAGLALVTSQAYCLGGAQWGEVAKPEQEIDVLLDADPEAATNGILAGIFAASGQTCVAGSRAYVQEGIAEEIIRRVTERAETIRLGDPADVATEMGPAASDAQRDRILAMIDQARAEGATVAAGGVVDPTLGGRFVRPTVITDVTNATTIVREEVFGPVLTVQTFVDEAEALALANDSDYGLAAGVWSIDIRRCHRMARRLDVGMVWINTYRNVSPMAPFGGTKQSGYGRDNGAEAMEEFLETKTVWVELEGATRDPFVIG